MTGKHIQFLFLREGDSYLLLGSSTQQMSCKIGKNKQTCKCIKLLSGPCVAPQVGPKGKVIGIDHIKELVDDSISNVKKDDPSLITSGRITLTGGASVMWKLMKRFSFIFTLKSSFVSTVKY